MARLIGKLLRIGVALIACSGCAADGLWSSARLMPWRRPATDASASGDSAVASDSSSGKDAAAGPSSANKSTAGQAAPPASASSATATSNPAADPAAMLAVLSQLKGIGAIDQATQDRLFDDLQKTDPSLWPQMLEVFRASLAYRQKYVEQPGGDQALAASEPRRTNVRPPADIAAEAAIASDAAARTPGQPNSIRTAATAAARSNPVQPASAEAAVPQIEAVAAAVGQSATGPGIPGQAIPQSPVQPQAVVTAPPQASAEPAIVAIEPKRLDWREHLQAAIDGLESETTDPPATTGGIGRHAGLRLLYLVDGRRDSALKPIAGIPPTQQDFWSKELFALTTYLDSDRTVDESRRAAAAALALREAAAKLGELATLSVRNLAFCSEVHSYGVFKKFPKYEFQAGQEVLLYAEVENFKTVANEKGFHTALKSSYEILDGHGARVDQKEFEITAEDCQNARRDYFIRYFVWMPKKIYGGNYTLQLTIEDTQSQKIGQSSIDFTIHEKDN